MGSFKYLDTILADYKNHIWTGDGYLIHSLKRFDNFNKVIYQDDPLVLIMVESRLLQPLLGSKNPRHDLEPGLQRLRDDLEQEGWAPTLIDAEVYHGNLHIDGMAVLAMRRVFQEIWANYPNFAGVLFVGAFPEAMLVMSYVETNWSDPWTYPMPKKKPVKMQKLLDQEIRIFPRIIAHRSDIVLGDLSGNWDKLYRHKTKNSKGLLYLTTDVSSLQPGDLQWKNRANPKKPVKIPIFLDGSVRKVGYTKRWIRGKWPWQYKYPGDTVDYFEDYFHINDAKFSILPHGKQGQSYDLALLPPDEEVGGPDKKRVNPISTPDIYISRINARNIAISLNPNRAWVHDSWLERELINDYFDRNHYYRKDITLFLPLGGSFFCMKPDDNWPGPIILSQLLRRHPHVPGALWYEYPAKGKEGDALDFVRFLRAPGLLKTILLHGRPAGLHLNYCSKADVTFQIVKEIMKYKYSRGGFCSLSNVKIPEYYKKGFEKMDDEAGLVTPRLLRTLWSQRYLGNNLGRFYYHISSWANSPNNADTYPYNSNKYANDQIAEGLLFFANGLTFAAASMSDSVHYARGVESDGKAKYYDERIIAGHTFGSTWKGNHEMYANNPYMTEPKRAFYRKIPYSWSVVGDWSLRMNEDRNVWFI